MTPIELLTIGEVASKTGLTVSAVRYYDEIGLIAATERVGGKRRFDPESVARIRLVREAQTAGFSLAEIATLLDSGAEWRSLVDEKLIELAAQRDLLDRLISTLRGIRQCGCGTVTTCERFADRFG